MEAASRPCYIERLPHKILKKILQIASEGGFERLCQLREVSQQFSKAVYLVDHIICKLGEGKHAEGDLQALVRFLSVAKSVKQLELYFVSTRNLKHSSEHKVVQLLAQINRVFEQTPALEEVSLNGLFYRNWDEPRDNDTKPQSADLSGLSQHATCQLLRSLAENCPQLSALTFDEFRGFEDSSFPWLASSLPALTSATTSFRVLRRISFVGSPGGTCVIENDALSSLLVLCPALVRLDIGGPSDASELCVRNATCLSLESDSLQILTISATTGDYTDLDFRIRTPRLLKLRLAKAGLVEIDAPDLAHLQINGLRRLRGASPFLKVEVLSIKCGDTLGRDDKEWDEDQQPLSRLRDVIQQCPNVRRLAIDPLHEKFRFEPSVLFQGLDRLKDLVLKTHQYLEPLLITPNLRLPSLRHLHVNGYDSFDIFDHSTIRPLSAGPAILAEDAFPEFPQLETITLYGSGSLGGHVLRLVVRFLQKFPHVELVTKVDRGLVGHKEMESCCCLAELLGKSAANSITCMAPAWRHGLSLEQL